MTSSRDCLFLWPSRATCQFAAPLHSHWQHSCRPVHSLACALCSFTETPKTATHKSDALHSHSRLILLRRTENRELSLFARVKCNDLCAVSLSSSFRALARTYVAHSLALSISVVSCSLRAVYELRLGARVVQAMSACNWLTLPAAEDALLIAA